MGADETGPLWVRVCSRDNPEPCGIGGSVQTFRRLRMIKRVSENHTEDAGSVRRPRSQ